MKVEQTGEFSICRFDEEDILETVEYWTPEMVESAKPIKMPQWDASELPENMRGYAEPLTPADADLTVLPYKCGGILTMQGAGGGGYYGSAQFLGDDRIVLTAAHCIYDRDEGAWMNAVRFFRAVQNGKYAKAFNAVSIAVRTAWIEGENADMDIDYGFVITVESSDAGFLDYNLGLSTPAVSFGYPGNIKSGQVMQTVNGIVQAVQGTRRAVMRGNPFKGGSSGGAWTDAQNRVFCLNSYGYVGYDDMYGPAFDDEFKALYDFVFENK